jgi:acetolactate synthase-1/2/3 large subunit
MHAKDSNVSGGIQASSSPTAELEGGDLIVHYLQQIGVEYIFGVPGGAIEPLVNAIARGMRRGGPELVVARHESGAAFMADGYARETGRLGVCFATTGPGATNMITGVAASYHNRNPVLAITAQTRLETFGRGAMQECSDTAIDTVGMYKYCTRYNSLVSHPKQLETKLIAAILNSFREPHGPSHLGVPLDIMRSPTTVDAAVDLTAILKTRAGIDENATIELAHILQTARKPAFVIGEGARSGSARILSLALALNAPVIATPHSKGFISSFHPCFRGVYGLSGHQSAELVVTDPATDCIVAVGCSLGEWATAGWDQNGILNHRLIHVDTNPENFRNSAMARLHVLGEPSAVFERLEAVMRPTIGSGVAPEEHKRTEKPALQLIATEAVQPLPNCSLDEPNEWASEAAPIKPQRLMRDLPYLLPAGTRFIADGTSAKGWSIHYLHIPDRRVGERRAPGKTSSKNVDHPLGAVRRIDDRRQAPAGLFRTSMEFSCMGWAIGHTLGAACARRDTPVVCLTGDGSMLMNSQEITVAAEHRLPVFFVVLNDSAMGTIRHGQVLGGAEQIGWQLPEVDFALMAKAMGVQGFTVRKPLDLEAIDWHGLWRRGEPAIIDVRIDREAVPPIKQRMKSLGVGH